MGTLHLLVQEASRSEVAKYKELLEDFLEKPNDVVASLQDWHWPQFKLGRSINLPMPHKIEINYTKKFANYDEILGWFNE